MSALIMSRQLICQVVKLSPGLAHGDSVCEDWLPDALLSPLGWKTSSLVVCSSVTTAAWRTLQ